ncbi:mannosyltransferase [Scheffersomyces amazonensis]|uniref:mannosyltransferase n=1 Tax=Scheffersomyces amazonensis TaxID=1078765 RepID=UPI00315C9C54
MQLIDDLIDQVSLFQEDQKIIIHKYRDDNFQQRENATFLMLCRNSELIDVLETIQSVQDRYNNKFNYDYTFLNDKPFDNEFIYLVSSFIPFGSINFGSIPEDHWRVPDFINRNKLLANLNQSNDTMLYGDSLSYRQMCRFYSGFFYKHELVNQYQYYWRLEPGIKIFCDIDYDVFKFMKENDKLYGFTLTMFEYERTIPTLWKNFQEYLKLHYNKQSQQLLKLVTNPISNTYNLCHFWTNFEIAKLSIYQNSEYENYFKFLDSKGGFFYERWGDAPIHSLGVSIVVEEPHQLHWFGDIGYYHQPYVQCPLKNQVFINNKCSCNPDDDFSFTDLSCTSHFLNVINGIEDNSV